MEYIAQPVIVGVDGSSSSLAAANYAAHMAIRRGRVLRLVYGYLHPLDYGPLGFGPYSPALPDPRADAEAMLSAAATRLSTRYTGLEIDRAEVAGGGAPVLIEASRAAELFRRHLRLRGLRPVGGSRRLADTRPQPDDNGSVVPPRRAPTGPRGRS